MGSLEPMPEMPDILQKARDAGVVVFAATGNDGQPLLRYPARYSHTLAVGALGRDGTFPADCPESFQESEIRRKKEFVAEFSNYGLSTDFIGPGVAVLSTFPGEKYAMMSGTSMATPYSSGMAARLLSGNSKLLNMPDGPEKADAIVKMLSQTAQKVGWSAEYEGFGVLK
jgi:subtilisin